MTSHVNVRPARRNKSDAGRKITCRKLPIGTFEIKSGPQPVLTAQGRN